MSNRPQPRLLQVVFLAGAVLWLHTARRRPKRSLLWSALLLAADLVAIPAILRAKPPLQESELKALKAEGIGPIDQAALRLPVHDREAFRKRSDMLLRMLVAAPVALLASDPFRRTAAGWLQEYIWGHALTYTIYTFSPLGPAFSDKYRPVVYRKEIPVSERRNGNNRNSQYSGHTGNAAFAGAFLAAMLARHAPGSIPLVLLPVAGVAMLRVRAQKHFPSDVLMAGCIGGFIGLWAGSGNLPSGFPSGRQFSAWQENSSF